MCSNRIPTLHHLPRCCLLHPECCLLTPLSWLGLPFNALLQHCFLSITGLTLYIPLRRARFPCPSRTRVNPGRTTSVFQCALPLDCGYCAPATPPPTPSRLHFLKVPAPHNITLGTKSQHLKYALSGPSDRWASTYRTLYPYAFRKSETHIPRHSKEIQVQFMLEAGLPVTPL